MIDWTNLDFTATVRDYDYTKITAQKIARVVESADFEDMDVDMIFQYLTDQMEIVSFGNYLKRYIFESAEIEAPFRDVTEEMYLDIISDSFAMSGTPYSMKKTTKKKTATFKGWLRAESVRRPVIFLLGFGLQMPAEDVTEFLTKVNKESDFNFENAQEIIYWYSYKKRLTYAQAKELMEVYETIPEDSATVTESKFRTMQGDVQVFLLDRSNLMDYLTYLKVHHIQSELETVAFDEFMKLYDQVREKIAENRNHEYDNMEGHVSFTIDDIQPADIESTICSGIPENESGNLQKMSGSLLSKQFNQKRMSRQRISAILKKKQPVERFDLITLLFYLYVDVEPDWPMERYIQYIETVNELLNKCGMMGIYPVNPYEAFILMCLLTDYPMDGYAEVWDLSFRKMGE